MFIESVKYNDLIATNQVMDISDIVTQSLSEMTSGAENGTIEDKLTIEQKEAITAIDGKYYVLPHYELYTGLVYDVDLFDERGYYFSQDGGFTSADEDKTVGPDGIQGTSDDGLASSYEELYELMDLMVVDGVVPFTWTVATDAYINNMIAGLTVAYEGKDQFMLNVTMDSSKTNTQATIIDSFNGDTPVEKSVNITSENAYLMSQQAGKYYAYKLAEKILSNENYHTKLDMATSHLDVQENYIVSKLKGGTSPVAMMIEGSYWWNEASEAMKRMENTYKVSSAERKFGWMPLPVQYSGSVTEGSGRKNTVMDTLNSFAFINARYEEDEVISGLAKLFLQYCYTDEQLVEFSITTGIPKGVAYDIPEDKLNEVDNYFQKSILKMKLESDVIYPYSANPIYINNQGNFMYMHTASPWSSVVDNMKFGNYYAAYKKKITAKEYFIGSFVSKDEWEKSYSAYFK